MGYVTSESSVHGVDAANRRLSHERRSLCHVGQIEPGEPLGCADVLGRQQRIHLGDHASALGAAGELTEAAPGHRGVQGHAGGRKLGVGALELVAATLTCAGDQCNAGVEELRERAGPWHAHGAQAAGIARRRTDQPAIEPTWPAG